MNQRGFREDDAAMRSSVVVFLMKLESLTRRGVVAMIWWANLPTVVSSMVCAGTVSLDVCPLESDVSVCESVCTVFCQLTKQ